MPRGIYERKPWMRTNRGEPHHKLRRYVPAMLACWAAGDTFAEIGRKFGCSQRTASIIIRAREVQGEKAA